MGDVCSTRLLAHDGAGLPRFLATPGVLTCITVFAWALSGVAVAAHVDLNAVLRGVRRCVRTGQDLDRTLHPLTSELRQCFGGVDAATVRIALVGGHRVSDHQPCLKLTLSKMPAVSRYHRQRKTEGNGADEREFLSWYVRAACVGAGLAAAVFDTILLNVFEGEICVSVEVEMRLRYLNQRFECAALDLHSGHIVTHTRYIENRDGDEAVMTPTEEIRQRQIYGQFCRSGDNLTLMPAKILS